VTVAPRIAQDPLVIDDYEVPAGTIVSLSTAAANHDPAVHSAPGRFDITADREPPLTFGGGPHYCLGANLARAEMQEALLMLAERMPDVRTAGEVSWRPRSGIFGPTTALPRSRSAVPERANGPPSRAGKTDHSPA
jgi:cytochrome P450